MKSKKYTLVVSDVKGNHGILTFVYFLDIFMIHAFQSNELECLSVIFFLHFADFHLILGTENAR